MFEILNWYGLLTLTHLFAQINFGHRDYLNSVSQDEQIDSSAVHQQRKSPYFLLSAAIVIPTYNEEPADLERCVQSALSQHYEAPFSVIVIDDGSKDKRGIQHIKEKFSTTPNLFIHEFEKNKGKRHAQKYAFDFFGDSVDIMVTIDSDTVLAQDSITHIVLLFADPKVGAVTGDVRAIKQNFLSTLIDARYWTAFNQERAAQSLFGTVLCCSGPLAAYRNTVIQNVKEAYVSQKFLGQYCTYGDDRHLTNLVLEQGYTVHYERRAKAWTYVPQKLKPWLKQQARWNRSFYRELLWTLKRVILKRKYQNIYMVYDLSMQSILPLLLLASLLFVCVKSVTESPLHLFGYLTILVSVALLRGTYAYLRTREKMFFLFPLYAFCHIFLLIPVRVYALCTLKTTKWGTR
ncbi:MAG: glycosyltransferase [Candidatus Thermoplasmatota archaeon]|nr:glycosyltransferase [Candidatus Thermoplasmatota archaeon]